MSFQLKNCLLLFLIFTSTFLFAQKLKKENFGKYNYIQPRATTILDTAEFFLLYIEVSDDDAFRRKLFENELAIQKFKIAGVDNSQDFTINIIEAPFKFLPSKKKSFIDKYKEKGVEKSRTMYYYTGKMEYTYMIKVLDENGEEIFRDLIKGTEKTRGGNSESMTSAHSMYVKDKYNSKDLVLKKCADKLSDIFNEHFIDQKKTIHVKAVKVLDKQFDYSSFHVAFNNLKSAYGVLSVNYEGTEESTKLLDDCISFWPIFLSESTPDDKKSRVNAKVTAAAHYNLGLACFFKKNFKDASIHFEKAGDLDKTIVAGIMNWAYVSKTCAERITVN